MAVANHHSFPVIEDFARSAGASDRGHRIGSIAPVGCFSLQTQKITAAGG